MARHIKVCNSPIHGRGVFAAIDLPPAFTVIEYKGWRLTHGQADRIYGGDAETGHTFLFTLNARHVIDANVGGNSARWINHSCDPNCQAVIEEDARGRKRDDRVLIETRRAIRAGEELTYDYGIVLDQPHTARLKKIWACHCGAANCTGTLLKPKRRKSRS